MPPREHFAAQQGTVARRGVDRVDRLLVVRVGGGFGTVEPVELLLASIRNAGHARIEIGDGTAQRARGDTGSGCAIAGDPFEPGARAVDRGGRQHAELIERLLVDREDGGVRESAVGEHRAQVGQHFVGGTGGHAVEHDADRDLPRGGALEQAPRHGVGVAVGGRDEEPQVGGGEQLCREGAVLVGDRVDVGGVDDRERSRNLLVLEQHELADACGFGSVARGIRCGARRADAAPHAREPGKNTVAREPAGIHGGVHENRLPCRRANDAHAGRRHAEQRVDDRRLA